MANPVAPRADAFAATVLAIAAEHEAAETRIKEALLREADDAAAVQRIVRAWTERPAVEVAAGLGSGPVFGLD